MTDKDLKTEIRTSVKAFAEQDISESGLALFSTLGYNTDRQNPFEEKTYAFFKDSFLDGNTRFNEDKAFVREWKSVDLLFQISEEEAKGVKAGRFDNKEINSFIFFAVELTKPDCTRTALAQITREINKIFPMPVMIVFRYGEYLTLSVINRRLHKKDGRKDVLEKVTLIKDISVANPHRAHIEILFDLSFGELYKKYKFSNFVELHSAWQKTLDIKELSKRFYQELANWYFWATEHVSFPDDIEKDKNIRNATSLIRLITRIIFIWFIKEKQLVPETLFDPGELSRILKVFAKNDESHSYYQAVLQNLFFGTLNQKMDERGFAREGSFADNKKNYGVKNLFRYTDRFAVSPEEAIALFKDIPFLNGGLFDCLDKENDEGRVLYADGFSRNPKKQAIVPDFLFFHAEEECDLNAVYGTKNKKYRVKGLFNILSGYKFTITENTPIEEEIALDPELLGKVFENLLASYNPETQTTARKQTGSFYTPREIVNYMADESLKAYFKQKLESEAGMKPEDAETGLELLIGYNDKELLFDKKQTAVLINAIDNCKILDPACGSGAFPMGVLHKLVYSLHKLDPQNRLWKEKQIDKVRAVDDVSLREKMIADIEAAFENNELDYGRKLYLIENCIYGVDIQPIAIQISKLRFFISLIVDQKVNTQKDNFGIRSLPNLETKFVAANTLIGLDKPQQKSLHNPAIDKLEDELKDLRHQYFSAKTRREKLDCQKKDKELREKISVLLVTDGWDNESAKQLSAFDPYDQNAGSTWFDPEWMFGVKDGFDIVIGNPPYVRQEKIGEQKAILLETFKDAGTGKSDLYVYFYAKGLQLLSSKGIECLICSNSWLDVGYGSKLQEFLLKNYSIKAIVHSAVERQFETAAVNTVISFIENTKPGAATETRFVTFKDTLDNALADKTLQREIVRTRDQLWQDGADESGKKYEGGKWGGKYLRAPDIFFTILEKGKVKLVRLGDIAEVRRGVTTGANEFFYLDDAQIEQWGIDSEFLQPVIKSPRECKRIVIDPADLKFRLFMCHAERKALEGTTALEYIKWGESQGFHNRPSCKGRARWWDLGKRQKSPIISPSSFSELYRVFLNQANVLADKRLYEIYFENEKKTNAMLVVLNTTLTTLMVELNSRTGLGEGLVDLTVYEVSSCLVLNPDELSDPSFFDRTFKKFGQEIKQADRRALDDIVFDVLGLTKGEREAVYEAVIQLVEQRLKKAKSV